MRVKSDVTVNTDTFRRLAAVAAEGTAKALDATGTIYVRMLAASTPPHKGVAENAAERLNKKKHPDILKAREAVSWNIAGVRAPEEITGYVEPERISHDMWDFRYIAGVKKPRGFFGMFVPVSWKQQKGERPPESTPQELYKGARWDGKKMVPAKEVDMSLVYSSLTRGFVNKSKLNAFVREKQSHVGKLISGWAKAARLFVQGNIAGGFFEELGGKGSAHKYADKRGAARAVVRNAQVYNDKQRGMLERIMPRIIRATQAARRVQYEKIFEAQLKKQKLQ